MTLATRPTPPAKVFDGLPVAIAPHVARWQEYLHRRRISEATIAAFGIAPIVIGHREAITYPLPGSPGSKIWHVKYTDGRKPKYKNPPGTLTERLYYHRSIVEAVKASKRLWIVSGPADVWAMYEAGIPHVLAWIGGELAVPDTLSDFVRELAPVSVHLAPDLDLTGDKIPAAVLPRLSLPVFIHELPASLGEHGDIGQFWQRYHDPDSFETALLGLPLKPIELPAARPATPTPPTSDKRLPAAYLDTIARTLGVTRFNSRGFSNPVICPHHDDKHPSAQWHQNGVLNCHTCGPHLAIETGTKLGIDWLAFVELPPTRAIHPPVALLPANTPQTSALPMSARQALLQHKLDSVARFLDCMYATSTPGYYTPKQAVERLTGYMSRATVFRTLKALSFSSFFNDKNGRVSKLAPSLSLIHCSDATFETHKKETLYHLPTPAQVCEMLGLPAETGKPLPQSALSSALAYRVAIYAELPRNKPGRYSRATLAGRVGKSNYTSQKYDKLAGLTVKPNYIVTPITDIEAVVSKEKKSGNAWVQEVPDVPSKGTAAKDYPHKRYPVSSDGIQRAMKASEAGVAYLVVQGCNYYAMPAAGRELVITDARTDANSLSHVSHI